MTRVDRLPDGDRCCAQGCERPGEFRIVVNAMPPIGTVVMRYCEEHVPVWESPEHFTLGESAS